MRLPELEHQVAQIARDVRRLGWQRPASPVRLDLGFATDEELVRLRDLLEEARSRMGEDASVLVAVPGAAGIVERIRERTAAGDRPARGRPETEPLAEAEVAGPVRCFYGMRGCGCLEDAETRAGPLGRVGVVYVAQRLHADPGFDVDRYLRVREGSTVVEAPAAEAETEAETEAEPEATAGADVVPAAAVLEAARRSAREERIRAFRRSGTTAMAEIERMVF